MKVNRIIIHNLKKEQQQKAELIISATALNPTDKKAVSLYGDKIKINKDKPDVVIIKSKSLADSIMREENKG